MNPHAMPGTLEVIAGCMYSGKTRKLLERIDSLVQREKILQLPYKTFLLFNPITNTRDREIKSRYSDVKQHCIRFDTDNPYQILDHLAQEEAKQEQSIDLVACDEVQFLPRAIIPITEKLLRQGKTVIYAGLDMDFRGEPFGEMGSLVLMADRVYTLTAVCNVCGGKATRTQRLRDGKPVLYDDSIIQVDTGGDEYQARCFLHHDVPGKPD
ncbi:MAG: thymidine kinase [archaeon]